MLVFRFVRCRFPRFLAPLLVAALAACVPLALGGGPTPTLDPLLYDLSILTDQPCAAPCWYGLEPGRSTKEQVLTTVHTLPFVDSAKTEQLPYYYRDSSRQIDKTGTYLRLGCRRPDGGPCAGLLLLDDVLKTINLNPPPALTFGELVAHLGPPEFVAAEAVVEGTGICGVALIWKQRRITAGFAGGISKQPQIRCADVPSGRGVSPDLPVEAVSYVSADDFALAKVPASGPYFPWPGFAKP